ncbi:GNAT family N-acetyltransferase [Klebsiella pneumoniae]|nr:GNAT family N-acetyltransferase [Klebsiella pneumoniae]
MSSNVPAVATSQRFGVSVIRAGSQQGRGVASALMRTMIDMRATTGCASSVLSWTVFADNAPAIAVYKKYGFEIEGTGRRYALRNGEYVDAYYMARMK